MKRLAVVLAMAVSCQSAIAAGGPVDRQFKIEFDELAARASAVIDTLQAMEARARAAGYSLHPNLVAQRVLVESSMDSAEKALCTNDIEQLGERLKRARALIDRLYRML
jgi:hypothetical protein